MWGGSTRADCLPTHFNDILVAIRYDRSLIRAQTWEKIRSRWWNRHYHKYPVRLSSDCWTTEIWTDGLLDYKSWDGLTNVVRLIVRLQTVGLLTTLYTRRDIHMEDIHMRGHAHVEDIHMRGHAHEGDRRGHVQGRTYTWGTYTWGTYTWRDIHGATYTRRDIHMEDIHIRGHAHEGACARRGQICGTTYTRRDIHMKRPTHGGHAWWYYITLSKNI